MGLGGPRTLEMLEGVKEGVMEPELDILEMMESNILTGEH